ncbi:hypothetical protein CS900_17810 [Enterobacter hormaechei]|nr:hypothetical protein CP997_04530 [Enterobacter hormaechei]PCP93385.1 hypothetical protein CP998_15340 [Enterobacter hormaechei]PCQ71682.1 hypothetical protein CQA47_20555 [Enterobacter hormaechei]PHZ97579.1 hypothetical protein CS900_17810 [Enterobacter hormaechei]PJD87966.1 hypothetical protein B9Q34_00030 [Enterobacter hormaechei]
MGHKTLLPVDVVLNTLRFSPSLTGRYSGKFAQFQRDMLPSWRGEELFFDLPRKYSRSDSIWGAI